MARITKIKYFTPERMALISEDNKKKYKKIFAILHSKKIQMLKKLHIKTYENFFQSFFYVI